MENPKEFGLDLDHFSLAGYAVKILYIIENILHKVGLHLGRILCIHDLITHRGHLLVQKDNGVCRIGQALCNMGRHVPFVLVLKGMLDGGPEVHCHGADLNLRLKLPGAV